jgi:hypothetical protein
MDKHLLGKQSDHRSNKTQNTPKLRSRHKIFAN